jgi:hypothetical protein
MLSYCYQTLQTFTIKETSYDAFVSLFLICVNYFYTLTLFEKINEYLSDLIWSVFTPGRVHFPYGPQYRIFLLPRLLFNQIADDFILKQSRDNDKSYRVKIIKL